MIIQEKKQHRFKIYIRVCKRCEELGEENIYFETPSRLCRYCPICKEIIKEEKIIKSLKARGYYKKDAN